MTRLKCSVIEYGYEPMKSADGIHEAFEGDVQYPFADVGAPELMHISSITQENRRSFTYTCPYCNKGLRPRLGIKKAHCFAHKPGESCNLDRYIHATAERLLKEKWERDEPFEITMNVRTVCKEIGNCLFHEGYTRGCVTEEMRTFNLKEQYTDCLVEKKYGDFVPDLCLIDKTGKHEPIFIEIWSKHKNSDKKAQSDYKIIEIRLKSTEDLEELPKHPITEAETVTFSHFKTLKKTPTKDDGPHLLRFTLYVKTLKCFVDDKDVFCGNYKSKHHHKSIFEIVGKEEDFQFALQFRNYCQAVALERGYDIRSCYLCKQYGKDYRNKEAADDWNDIKEGAVGCRRELETMGIIKCKPDDALTCAHYQIKDNQLKRLRESYPNITCYVWCKNPDGTIAEEMQKRKTYWDYHHNDEY